jgi:pimeloyl-ACP methyl ester carboxylesterase
MIGSKVTRRSLVGAAVAGSTLAATTVRAQAKSKTFVLVHGTYVGGWYWRRVADLLEGKGHKVFAPTLTGLGERSHLLSKGIDLDTHVTDVVNVFKWEDLKDVCLAVHSYGGWIGSGVLEQIGDRVSSIVWVDAYRPDNGQKPVDLTSDAFRKLVLAAAEKGEPGFPAPPKLPPIFVNEKDRDYVDSKLTAHPVGTYMQPIKLTGAREAAAKKTFIRATKFPNPVFDKALAECKADKSWTTFEINAYHIVMLDEPQWLAETLQQSA